MRDNTNSFKALSRKLGREIKNCECCGADITNSIWRINQEDILSYLVDYIAWN